MNDLGRRAYYAMPAWVQSLMLSAYGLRMRYLRYGGDNARVLAELLASQWLPAEQLRELQLVKLNSVLMHAAENVPFYRKRGLPERVARLEELSRVPLLRKAEIRTAGQTLVDASIGRRPPLAIHTGGTTGTPLSIYCDRAALQRNYAFFSRLRAWAQVPPGTRVALFAGRTFIRPDQKRPPYWRSNLAANTLMMSSYFLSPQTVRAYIERLQAFQPVMIDAYPSSVEFVARWILKTGTADIRPRAVITSSETLLPAVREVIQKAFGCPVFDYYGGAEMAAFVSQCEAGSYHANPEFGVLEILKENGEPAAPGESGEIVATGFINPVMPLIRYATGDEAVQGGASCPCGRAFPTLERIEGRRDDVLVTPEGRRIGRLDPIFKGGYSIQEARIVQDARDHVRLEVVPDAGFSFQEEALLVQELATRLGPSVRIDVARVMSIPRAPSGKLRMVVREADVSP